MTKISDATLRTIAATTDLSLVSIPVDDANQTAGSARNSRLGLDNLLQSSLGVDISTGKRRTLFGTVIRFSTTWQTLFEIDGSHPGIGVVSVAQSSTQVTVTWDTAGLSNVKTVTGWAAVDETYAAEGLQIGCSQTATQSKLEFYRIGISDYIRHDGPGDSDWSSLNGLFENFSWNATDDRLDMDTVPAKVIVPHAGYYGGMAITGRGVHVVEDGSQVSGTWPNRVLEARTQFITYGAAAAQETPTGSPAFRVNCGTLNTKLDPTADFTAAAGSYLPNIWLGAIYEHD